MIKDIYHYLGETFWTQRKCQICSISFTPTDYQTQNYQLFFQRVLKIDQSHLIAIIQLAHKQCCSGCLNYQKKWPKKENSTN